LDTRTGSVTIGDRTLGFVEGGHLTVAFEPTPKIHEWLLQHAGD
jgi:hypothetical protein